MEVAVGVIAWANRRQNPVSSLEVAPHLWDIVAALRLPVLGCVALGLADRLLECESAPPQELPQGLRLLATETQYAARRSARSPYVENYGSQQPSPRQLSRPSLVCEEPAYPALLCQSMSSPKATGLELSTGFGTGFRESDAKTDEAWQLHSGWVRLLALRATQVSAPLRFLACSAAHLLGHPAPLPLRPGGASFWPSTLSGVARAEWLPS